MDYTSLNRIGLCTKKPLKAAKMSGYHTQTAAHNPEAGDSRSTPITKKYTRDMRCLFMLDTQNRAALQRQRGPVLVYSGQNIG